MAIIWMVRHGQASFGGSDYDVLSETGEEQSRLTGLFFKEAELTFDAWYSGTMKRQIDSAGYAGAEAGYLFDLKKNPSFNEYNFKAIIKSQLPGIVEKEPELKNDLETIFKDKKSFQKIFGKIMKRWISGQRDHEGVETYIDFKKRVKTGLFSIAEEHEPGAVVALFTSGGVLSAAMQLSLGLSDKESMRLGWYIQNASVSKFKLSNGRLNLLMFNQMSHLERFARSELLTYR